jgi:hypothetical protein
LDTTAQQEISRLLEPGESLLWAGKPRQGLFLRPSDVVVAPITLFWAGFVIAWEIGVLSSGPQAAFWLWGVPFVIVGLYITVGRFFVDARSRAKTYYALTNRRIVIASGLFVHTIHSLPLRTLSHISVVERKDGTGTILLGHSNPYTNWMVGTTPSFEQIPEAKRVHDQILEAQRSVG